MWGNQMQSNMNEQWQLYHMVHKMPHTPLHMSHAKCIFLPAFGGSSYNTLLLHLDNPEIQKQEDSRCCSTPGILGKVLSTSSSFPWWSLSLVTPCHHMAVPSCVWICVSPLLPPFRTPTVEAVESPLLWLEPRCPPWAPA